MGMPCGRRSYCGRVNCPHAGQCHRLQREESERRRARQAGEGHFEGAGEGEGHYEGGCGPECGSQPRPEAWAAGPEGGPGGRPAPARAAAPRPLAEPADLVYLYDGSLPGLYCCVHESVYTRQLPCAIWPAEEAQPTLFESWLIATDRERALKVRESIPRKISSRALELVEGVYLTCLAEKEVKTLRFLLLGYRQGRQTTDMLGHPDVAPLLAAERHMGGEAHLLKGFIRFSDYDGVLAATITPKNFVLPFLADHFAARYSGERFMIYDKTHRAALIYEERQYRIVPLEGIEFPEADEKEEKYRALWKRFYKTIAIEARENPKCRMTHMPKRYWENMTEMSELL